MFLKAYQWILDGKDISIQMFGVDFIQWNQYNAFYCNILKYSASIIPSVSQASVSHDPIEIIVLFDAQETFWISSSTA